MTIWKLVRAPLDDDNRALRDKQKTIEYGEDYIRLERLREWHSLRYKDQTLWIERTNNVR